NVGVAAFRAAQHLDTHYSARAGIIGDIEHRLHLNHFSVSNLSGPNALRAGSFGSRSGREKAADSTRNQNLCQALRSLPNPPTRRPGRAHFTPAFSFRMVRTRAMSRRTLFSWLLLVSCCVAFCMRRPN